VRRARRLEWFQRTQYFRILLRSSLEPIVGPAGLSWNESGLGYQAGELRALFEGDKPEFVRPFPSDWFRYQPGRQPGCIDLWITYDTESKRISADLEGTDVEEWLRSRGHAPLAVQLAAPAEQGDAVDSLARGLRLMLEPALAEG
jgi:hypothetical protein